MKTPRDIIADALICLPVSLTAADIHAGRIIAALEAAGFHIARRPKPTIDAIVGRLRAGGGLEDITRAEQLLAEESEQTSCMEGHR